jgi:mercuric ion transport protein
MLLGSLGLAGAWLGSLALLAGPYRLVLLASAVVCLAGGGLLFWRRHSVVACAPGAASGRLIPGDAPLSRAKLAQKGIC